MKKIKLKTFLISAGIALSLLGCKDTNNTKQNIKETKEYQLCMNTYSDLKPGENYEAGSILVGFDEGVRLPEINKFIEKHNLNGELEILSYYDFINYTKVKVPEGEELHYICYFKSIADGTIIYSAEPNIFFTIHDSKNKQG